MNLTRQPIPQKSGRPAKDPDSMTIPLCKSCHQDGPDAIHANKRAWRERHGPDYGYLREVDDMLGEWF